MGLFSRLAASTLALALAPVVALAEPQTLTAAVLKTGTVNWELDTITHYGLDAAHGFSLQVDGYAGNPATRVAFQGGEADIVVADWLWVAHQRAEGKDYVFIPYSKAVGALLVPADSSAQSLADLAGQKIGIAGGPTDKSWLILRAFAEEMHGMDLAAETEQVFGAPPLIFKTAVSGELGGAINFWHFQAKMEAKGMRKLVDVADAAQALGLDPETPLLGYVVHGDLLRAHPDLVAAFAAASRDAKTLLQTDTAAWDRLRDQMNAGSDAEFEGLKAGFIAGIPTVEKIDQEAAARMLELMGRLGGEELVGQATTLPEGLFYSGS